MTVQDSSSREHKDTSTKPNTPKGSHKVSLNEFLHFAEKWLSGHFSVILGEDAILSKAAAFLCGVLILFFNYLKHRYDVGYYHKVFGVPEEYLGFAWNNSMTDFVLNALIFIFWSLIIIGVIGAVCICLVLVFSRPSSKSYKTICFLSKYIFPAIAVILFRFRRTIHIALMWISVCVGSVFLVLAIAVLVWDSYQKSIKTQGIADNKNKDSSKAAGLKAKQPLIDRFKSLFRKSTREDSLKLSLFSNQENIDILKENLSISEEDKSIEAPEQSLENNQDESYTPLSPRARRILIVLLCLGLMSSGFCACRFGQKMASLETNMMYIYPDEELADKLHKLNSIPEDQRTSPEPWAVICRDGDHYVIMPCKINEKRAGAKDDELTVYPKYHCVIPAEGVVLVNGVFERVIIDGNPIIDENGWKNAFDQWLPRPQNDSVITTEPSETGSTEETTEPPLPTEPTEPPPPTETTASSEDVYLVIDSTTSSESVVNISFSDGDGTSANTSAVQNVIIHIAYPDGALYGCGCCRCTPGLG